MQNRFEIVKIFMLIKIIFPNYVSVSIYFYFHNDFCTYVRSVKLKILASVSSPLRTLAKVNLFLIVHVKKILSKTQ